MKRREVDCVCAAKSLQPVWLAITQQTTAVSLLGILWLLQWHT
jgi:hypothetical protein